MAPPPSVLAVPASGSVADRVLAKIQREDQIWGNYCVDLSLDALLEIYLAGGDLRYRDAVLSLMYRRNLKLEEAVSYRSQPFGHLHYRIYLATGDQRLVQPFLEESRRYFEEVSRSADGLVLHAEKKGAQPKVLIDSMQDYASRMARAGRLSGEAFYYKECIEQFRRHRNALRNPATGLWCQGRGWEADPQQLSPGAWSRGQGWALRGMVDALVALPPGSAEEGELRGYYTELLQALLPRQDAEGMWHVLPERTWAESEPESSGTALICWALYEGLARGWLSAAEYRGAAERAFAALERRVGPDGSVHQACVGPGPLRRSDLPLYENIKFREAEDHGRFAVLYACAGKLRFERGLKP